METMEVQDSESSIPQDSKLSADQVMNNAGGYIYKVDDMTRLRRFICLGTEGGTFYVGEKELGLENAQAIQKLIEDGHGKKVVEEITLFSVEGRAAKQNPIIFALAICARQDTDKEVKRLAYNALPKICRIPTHLFLFVEYCEKLSRGTGWGKAHKRAISNWYVSHKDNALRLAMHITKYKNRNGWTHRDLLRLSHPKPQSIDIDFIFKFITKGLEAAQETFIKDGAGVEEHTLKVFNFLKATRDIQKLTDEGEVVKMISTFGLVREHVPTQYLNSKLVWEALLEKMPLTAMLRNLAKMTVLGLLENDNEASKIVANRLVDANALKKARIHPFNVLTALHVYSKGSGEKGKLKWNPVIQINSALDSAFYKSFKSVEPTGLRHLIALDVSGSMSWGGIVGSSSITPRQGSAAMSMVTARTEKQHEFIGFSHRLVKLPVKSNMNIDEVCKVIDSVPMGGTDCAQPMIWAEKNEKKFDVFIIYTDCETWAGNVHPSQALRDYRKASGIWNAKLIICAMTSNGFTLADPEDPGMLDMAGFDSAAPEIIRNFSLGFI